ncbi:prepilin-type N-terminal cleavage/methylation domain-containing protein [Kribbella sp. VKM Ac-2571]|uniref:type II secretion system protein n=1 Tax=Kribbella sp. VKM Ac-2571 TaxID=2512222 RepID=UPI0010D797D5|nr:prepilin-type N-terminal cleavage/methylation domain-containing protein [Kribbella sp. VKM Ac-2571]TDO64046.1 prepilin-type N-terminal cleavage/methylation domain-containing protein [Kribbella sp. VKM Ac-2571]
MSRTRRRPRSDAGFTIVELLVAVVILGVITVPLSNAVIGILHNAQGTSARLELSHDAQIAGAYFAADAATLGVRDYVTEPVGGGVAFNRSFYVGSGGPACGPSSIVKILSDNWQGGSAATDVVSYFVDGTDLRRAKCERGSTTPSSNTVVAHHVKTVGALKCKPSCSDNAPQTLELTLTVATAQADDYTFTLSGQRRQT